MLLFEIHFNSSTHYVNVVLHNSASAMRREGTRKGHKTAKQSDAFCWQAHLPAVDGCVAEIHLAKDLLDIDVIAHECCHAAFHRAKLCGVPPEEFEEQVATDTGILTDALVSKFSEKGVDIKVSGC